MSHSERCKECKVNIRNMLAELYSDVEVNAKIEAPCKLEDLTGSPAFEILSTIHQALQKHRGFREFVKAKSLPRVDFYIPGHRMVVEFDESQHFTKPREVALSLYPNRIRFGFSVRRWISLCRELDKRDNDPPYRDEQRAWYDTLRDFLPILRGEGQTVRIYAGDRVWCRMNPRSKADLNEFRFLLTNSWSGR